LTSRQDFFKPRHYEKVPSISIIPAGLVTVSLQAGEPVAYKQVAPPPPPLYGTGFYGALDIGANVFQNLGDTRTFDETFTPFSGSRLDFDLKVEPNNQVGVFGDIKLGYVFGTGVIRPTIEGDFFYNGFRPGWDATLNSTFTACPGVSTVNLSSGARECGLLD
jgi:hypothetical protein